MIYKQLGKTDINISRIGFGCWALGGHGYGHIDFNEIHRSIEYALDNGINFFDTADVYGFGKSEAFLGNLPKSKKNKMIIATKVGVSWNKKGEITKNLDPNYIQLALENSLKRLKVECIDLYQIHWMDKKNKIEDVLSKLIDLRDQGKIRFIGCSNFDSHELTRASKISKIQSVQCNYNFIQNHDLNKIANVCNNLNVNIIGYSILARGLLSGNYQLNSKFGKNDTRSQMKIKDKKMFKIFIDKSEKLKYFSNIFNLTPSTLSIKLALRNSSLSTALIGITKKIQVEDCISAVSENISEDDLNEIQRSLL